MTVDFEAAHQSAGDVLCIGCEVIECDDEVGDQSVRRHVDQSPLRCFYCALQFQSRSAALTCSVLIHLYSLPTTGLRSLRPCDSLYSCRIFTDQLMVQVEKSVSRQPYVCVCLCVCASGHYFRTKSSLT